MGHKWGGAAKTWHLRCHWWSYSLSWSRCPRIEGVMEIRWGSAPWTRMRVSKASLWEARVKMQPSYIVEPSILQMPASWDDYQDQQHLWSRASLSPGDKLCVLQRGGSGKWLRYFGAQWIMNGSQTANAHLFTRLGFCLALICLWLYLDSFLLDKENI